MNKIVSIILLVLIVSVGCSPKDDTVDTDIWKSIVDLEWRGENGIAGDAFYFYMKDEVPTCTYLLYGSGFPVIFHSTSNVFIDDSGLIQVNLEVSPDSEEKLLLTLEFNNEYLRLEDSKYYGGQYGGNPLQFIEDFNQELEPKETLEPNASGNKVIVETSDHIRIFDGRTGDSVYINSKEYINRIIDLVENLRYTYVVNKLPGAGSSYNIIFENEDKQELSSISMGWPEDTVIIDEICYELNVEDKYLLYSYAADVMNLMKFNDINRLEDEVAELNESMELKADLISEEFISGYISHKYSDYGGFYSYGGEDSPLIYPSPLAPHVSEEVILWLEENPLVEVIMRTNNNIYLVRIPGIENYVYVNESNLIAPVLIDRPVYEELDITINGCTIGDDISKLKGEINGDTSFGVENGSMMVSFIEHKSESITLDKGLAFVNAFNEIIGLRVTSDEFILDNKFRTGDLAVDLLTYYDNKHGRDKTYLDDGYVHEQERYIYIVGDYCLEFSFNSEEISEETTLEMINLSHKWW